MASVQIREKQACSPEESGGQRKSAKESEKGLDSGIPGTTPAHP